VDSDRGLSFKLKVSCPKEVDNADEVLDLYEKRFHEVVSGAERLAGSEGSFRAKFKFPGRNLPSHSAEFQVSSNKPGKESTKPNFVIRNAHRQIGNQQNVMLRFGGSFPDMPRFPTWCPWVLDRLRRWLPASAGSDAGEPDEKTSGRKRKVGELAVPDGGSSKKARHARANHGTVAGAQAATSPLSAVASVALGAARAVNAAAQAALAASESIAREIEAIDSVTTKSLRKETWYHVNSDDEEGEEDAEDSAEDADDD
jgi:hypothetical protein